MYKRSFNNSVLRLRDNTIIPMDDGNKDCQAYKQWLMEGNKPEPADVPDEAPLVRSKRDELLRDTDWMLLPDSPLKGEALEIVKEYRQQLRDITLQAGFPDFIAWPHITRGSK